MQASKLHSIKDSPELVFPSYEELAEEAELRCIALGEEILAQRFDRPHYWEAMINILSATQLEEWNRLEIILNGLR